MSCHSEKAVAPAKQKIQALNDRLRQHGKGGRTMLTRAVAALEAERLQAVLAAVQRFDSFTRDNDPWGEHEFGQVEIGGERYFWKIEAYDLNMEFGSPDPSDEAVTCRVITIMTGGDL